MWGMSEVKASLMGVISGCVGFRWSRRWWNRGLQRAREEPSWVDWPHNNQCWWLIRDTRSTGRKKVRSSSVAHIIISSSLWLHNPTPTNYPHETGFHFRHSSHHILHFYFSLYLPKMSLILAFMSLKCEWEGHGVWFTWLVYLSSNYKTPFPLFEDEK